MSRQPCLASLVILALALGLTPGRAGAQCLLANPSFELTGSGSTFGGWSQFGPTGLSSVRSHGQRAARVSGPNTGSWEVAGFWQSLATAPGERWVATVRALNTPAKPLSGGSTALLNIEWRNSSGALLSYESHTVASAASPTGQWLDFSVTSAAAPAGATQARLLLGVLQGPTDPQPDVLFDQATFEKLGPPSLDAIQWNDFGGGRTLSFSGRTWRVKGPGYFGPGPNLFSNSVSSVWVDAEGRLHLTNQNIAGQWYSTEVAAVDTLGYGDYVFTTVGRLDLLDPSVVFGLFIWQYGRCYDTAFLWWNPFNEIDVEFSRWGNPANGIAQFVAQPFDYPGNIQRFDPSFAVGERTSHAFRWSSDRIEFRSWRGGPYDESPGNMIQAWTYTGPHIPRPEQPRVHINLWRFAGVPASTQEVVLDAFTFIPAGAVLDVPAAPAASGRRAMLAPAQPNPASGATRLRFTLARDARIELEVHDLSGRSIRVLAREHRTSGTHEVAWDGLDTHGRRAAPGVYVVRLSAAGLTETSRVVLLK